MRNQDKELFILVSALGLACASNTPPANVDSPAHPQTEVKPTRAPRPTNPQADGSATLRACTQGSVSEFQVSSPEKKWTVPIDANGCADVEQVHGERLVLYFDADDQKHGAVLVAAAPDLKVTFDPSPGASEHGRFSPEGEAATLNTLATEYLGQGRAAIREPVAAKDYSNTLWEQSERAGSTIATEGLRTLSMVALLASGADVDPQRLSDVFHPLSQTSPAWAIEPEALLLLHGANFLLPPGRLQAIFSEHPDANVRGAAAIVIIETALRESDPETARSTLARLNDDDNSSIFAKIARSYDPDGTLVEGRGLPEVELTAPNDGAPVLLSSPKKPSLVFFWSSWCKPCVETIENVLIPLHKRKDLRIVTVSLDEQWSDTEAVRKRLKMPWEHAYVPPAEQARVRKEFEIWSSAKLLLVDQEGVLLLEDPKDKRRRIDEALKKP